jgi:hypothetical protein
VREVTQSVENIRHDVNDAKTKTVGDNSQQTASKSVVGEMDQKLEFSDTMAGKSGQKSLVQNMAGQFEQKMNVRSMAGQFDQQLKDNKSRIASGGDSLYLHPVAVQSMVGKVDPTQSTVQQLLPSKTGHKFLPVQSMTGISSHHAHMDDMRLKSYSTSDLVDLELPPPDYDSDNNVITNKALEQGPVTDTSKLKIASGGDSLYLHPVAVIPGGRTPGRQQAAGMIWDNVDA